MRRKIKEKCNNISRGDIRIVVTIVAFVVIAIVGYYTGKI